MKKTIALVLVLLAFAALGYWYAEGAHIYTKTERQVEVKDELFGTTTTEWEKDFQPGLEYTGPLAGLMLATAAFLFWRARKEERTKEERALAR